MRYKKQRGNKRPEKLRNLLEVIKSCIETGRYVLTEHALERQVERKIDLPLTLYVLKTGFEEKTKTYFDKQYNAWKYAIKGLTLDGFFIRVIVAFDEDGMLIITVMYVD